jgi:hypothetical protein
MTISHAWPPLVCEAECSPCVVQASAGEAAVRVVLILQNLVLLLFMGGLTWIFRMRGDSPYLMVDEEEGGAAEGGDAHLRTELGVLGEVPRGNLSILAGWAPAPLHPHDRQTAKCLHGCTPP